MESRKYLDKHGLNEINGKVHPFLVNDKSHQQSNEISIELNKLYDEMKLNGYIPNTKFVTHNMDEKDNIFVHIVRNWQLDLD